MGELEGKVAVITGAGSGMGRACSHVFVREGARVLAADISGREDETAAVLGDAVKPFRVDVTQEEQVEAMFAAAIEAFGQVDAVLNVAGIGGAEPVHKITMAEYDRIMDVDLRGVLLGTKHAILAMRATGGGSIVNWSSIGGLNASDMPTSVYSAAKAGVISFTKAAAVEYGTKGIRANAICPGLIVTELSGGQAAIDNFPQLVEGAAMKRAGQPEEVAELASFLASDRSSFITGAVIPIDGGNTCALR
jgi:NAD(P)-dependent dehydrogenase (short-subunit alcohol dehydrogenase family)